MPDANRYRTGKEIGFSDCRKLSKSGVANNPVNSATLILVLFLRLHPVIFPRFSLIILVLFLGRRSPGAHKHYAQSSKHKYETALPQKSTFSLQRQRREIC